MKYDEYNKYIAEYLNSNITVKDLAKKYNLSYYGLQHQISKRNIKRIHNYGEEINYARSIKNKLINDYIPGETSLKSLAEKYNINNYKTIADVLKENNIETVRPKLISRKTLKEASEYYINNNISIINCAKKFKIGKNTLYNYLKENNLIRSPGFYQKDISYNENFFDKIDTEEKAYWLGFIMADGYTRLNKKNNPAQTSIEISKRDIEILNAFRNSIESNHIIRERSRRTVTGKISEICSITISSEYLTSKLISYGVVPNKTYIGYINEEIFNNNEELIFHYLRGYSDGDGTIDKRKGHYVFKLVIKSESILNTIKNWIKKYCNIEPKIKLESCSLGSAYRLSIQNKKEYFIFLGKLYKNANIYLDRKYQNYLSHKSCAVPEEKP
jgi:mobile intron protein